MNLISILLAQHDLGGSFRCIGGYCPPEAEGGTLSAPAQVTTFTSNLFGFLTTVAGLMFILYFVLGGLRWISAGGDAQKVETAKTQMTQAAIGVIVVVSAWAIAFIIGTVLGLDILNPQDILGITPGGPAEGGD